MGDSSSKRVTEQFAGTHLIHEQGVAPEANGIASNSAVTETLLGAYDPTFPPYDDWDVIVGHHYVYELAVGSGSNRRVYISPPVKPTPPPVIPDPGSIDRVSQPEQPIEILATKLNDVAQEKLEE